MNPQRTRRRIALTLPLVCAFALSCRSARNTRPYREPPPPDVRPTLLAYADTDGFDALFESALTNQDPLIVVQTDTPRPDWGPRLNAWIAAWNRGGKVVEEPRRRPRMQAPLGPAAVNGDTVRELRLLVDDLMTRAEDLARRGSSWWAEERTQRRRIDLLRPYSLRFHLNDDGLIQLVFFNGMYAPSYRQVMEAMAIDDPDEPPEWQRAVRCSHCKGKLKAQTAQRTRQGEEEAQNPN